MDRQLLKFALSAQKNELSEHHIYLQLANHTANAGNAEVLRRIANQELEHATFWASQTGMQIKPSQWKIFSTTLLARLLGLTFILKLMEKREGTGSNMYAELSKTIPEAERLSEEEKAHEKEILGLLDEEKLNYVGSMVLGLNDALVELTGALAGFTLALGETKTISMAGLVTGISAALSMASSDYLSSKAKGDATAKKSAVYTGVTYLLTVVLLILPFLLCANKFTALALTFATVVIIIYCFNYYISVAKDLNFKARFFEMTGISLGVAAFSFLVGYLLKLLLGVQA